VPPETSTSTTTTTGALTTPEHVMLTGSMTLMLQVNMAWVEVALDGGEVE